MDNHEQSIIAVAPRNGRRRRIPHSFKRELVEQTLRADVSIASVALANGLNEINFSAKIQRFSPRYPI